LKNNVSTYHLILFYVLMPTAYFIHNKHVDSTNMSIVVGIALCSIPSSGTNISKWGYIRVKSKKSGARVLMKVIKLFQFLFYYII